MVPHAADGNISTQGRIPLDFLCFFWLPLSGSSKWFVIIGLLDLGQNSRIQLVRSALSAGCSDLHVQNQLDSELYKPGRVRRVVLRPVSAQDNSSHVAFSIRGWI